MSKRLNSGQADQTHMPPQNQAVDYARLVFRTPDGGAIVKDVLRPTTLIGRIPGCNIQLVSDEIGMAHCLLTLDDGTLQVRDLRSRTGVLLNGSRVEISTLHDGDRMQIGPFECRVETKLTQRTVSPEASRDGVPAATIASDPASESTEILPSGEPDRQNETRFEKSTTDDDPAYARLVFELPNGTTTAKDVLRHTTLIGSFPGCNIQLVSSEIAPAHCAVTLDGGVLRMRDLRSRAGTLVNGVAVEVCELKNGDELRIGAFAGRLETNLLPISGPAVRPAGPNIDDDHRQCEIDRLRAETLRWRHRAELFEEEQQRLSRQLQQYAHESAETAARQQQAHQQIAKQEEELASERERLRAERERLDAERGRIADESRQLRDGRCRLNAERREMESDRETLEAEQQRSTERTAELDRIRCEAEKRSAELTSLQQELERSRSELSEGLRVFHERQQKFEEEAGAFEAERAALLALSEELSRAKSKMAGELSALHQQHAAVDTRSAQLDEDRGRLESLEQHLCEREQQCQDESAVLQTEREQLAIQRDQVSQQAIDQERRAEDLDKQRTKLQAALSELRAGEKQLQADVKQTALLKEQLRNERDAVQSARKLLETERQQAKKSAKDLERGLEEAGKSLHSERERLETQQKVLDERTARLNRQTELLKDQVQDVQREHAELLDSKREFEADLRDLRLEYERLRAEAASVEEARGQLEHQRLDCEQTAGELEQLQAELNRQRGEVEKERQRLNAEQETGGRKGKRDRGVQPAEEDARLASLELAHVEAGVSPPEPSLLRMLDDFQELQQRHERCRVERDELHVAQKQLETAVKHFGKKQQLFHQRLAAFECDWHGCKQLETRAARARADLDRLELKRDHESEQFEQERQQLQAERSQLKARLRRFREDRQRLYQEVAEFQHEHDIEGVPGRSGSEAPLERDLQRLVQLHENFRSKKKALHSNRKQLRTEVGRFWAKRRSWQQKRESAQPRSGWIELRIQRARETLTELHDRRQELIERRERFRAERAALRAERSQLESRFENLTARQQRLVQEQPASFNVEFDRLKGLHEDARALLGRLEQSLAALEARHRQLPVPSEAAESACNNCREELRVLRSERRRFRRATAALNAARQRLEQSDASPANKADVAVAESLMANGIINRSQADWFLKGRFGEYHVDGYRVVDHLDTRALGWLYRAVETATGRQVALKALSERFAGEPEIVARFEIEARTGARLNHPHIVRTLEYDCVDNVHYLTMPFVEGINLREMVDLHGPLSYRQACDLITQAAAGLQYMHENGLVHRDVKPSNLLVTSDGRLKLLDFGLTLVDGDEDEFSLAMIFGHDCLGTADYVAPEQTRDSFAVDARADVYSLGCTLFFALTGRVPFAGESVIEKLAAHRNGDSRAIRKLAPRIPAPVQAIVETMMASHPADRFQTASDVAAALAPWGRRVPAYFDFHTVQGIRAARTRRRLYRDANAIRSGEDPLQVTEVEPDSQPPLAVSRAIGDVRRSDLKDVVDSG